MRRSIGMLMAVMLAAGLLSQISPPATLAAGPNVGYLDDVFGDAPGSAPTADKPQSKLWFNDGAWWAVMFNAGDSKYHIYRLTWPDKWLPTATLVDDRPLAHADCLWDGTHLYIATTLSNVETNAANEGRLYRYSYAGGVYTLDTGFPTVMMTKNVESLAIDQDTFGKLWITFTSGSKVYVNRSTTNDATWGTPFVVPDPNQTGATSLNSDDISSLVAYHDQNGSSIGVLWSNHNKPSSMYFSYHKDGDPDLTWQPIESIYAPEALACAADDHINLKSLQSDPSGAIYAAVKTSFGDSGCGGSSSSPLIRLVVRKPNNTWKVATFGTVHDDHTRPLVLLDTSNRMVYMFATSPTKCGVIYMKSTSMDTLSFTTGPGAAFIRNSTYDCINNATSTKQTVNAASGLVVLASDGTQKAYLHNVLALGSPPVDTTAPVVTAKTPSAGAASADIATTVTATFSEPVVGVSSSSFTLTPAGGAAVAANVSYDSATRTATLTPAAALATSTTYTASLGSPIADSAGNPLAPVSWSFSTAAPLPDTTPPTVIARNPASGAGNVAPATTVMATFSEAMDAATISAASVSLTGPAAAGVAAVVSYDAASRTVTLTPGANLSFSSTYMARLSGAIKDLAGNPLAPVSWSFSTAAPPPDTTPPTVLAVSPPNGAAGVGTATDIRVNFSEPIDSTTITSADFTLTSADGVVIDIVSYDHDTNTAILHPSAPLADGTTYTAQITGVSDMAGNELADAVSWSFTTAAGPLPHKLLLPALLR
jgi:hypothetical protein